MPAAIATTTTTTTTITAADTAAAAAAKDVDDDESIEENENKIMRKVTESLNNIGFYLKIHDDYMQLERITRWLTISLVDEKLNFFKAFTIQNDLFCNDKCCMVRLLPYIYYIQIVYRQPNCLQCIHVIPACNSYRFDFTTKDQKSKQSTHNSCQMRQFVTVIELKSHLL